MFKLIFHVIAGILGFWLAVRFVPGVELTGSWQTLVLAGVILGLINFFIKPIINLITMPLRMLTLGLFGLAINLLIVWVVGDILFPGELEIHGIIPLFWTTAIIFVVNYFLGFYTNKRKVIVEE